MKRAGSAHNSCFAVALSGAAILYARQHLETHMNGKDLCVSDGFIFPNIVKVVTDTHPCADVIDKCCREIPDGIVRELAINLLTSFSFATISGDLFEPKWSNTMLKIYFDWLEKYHLILLSQDIIRMGTVLMALVTVEDESSSDHLFVVGLPQSCEHKGD